jgi:hypothetical protein
MGLTTGQAADLIGIHANAAIYHLLAAERLLGKDIAAQLRTAIPGATLAPGVRTK